MVHLFPELRDAHISHSWCGFVAYKFDDLMHIGQQVLGLPQGRTALDDVAFQTRPLYTGNPWFLAPSVMYYRWRDRLSF